MHPVLTRYLKLEKELDNIARNLSHNMGLTSKEVELLNHAFGCPFCAKDGQASTRWYKLACQCIVDILKKNGFEVSAVIDQLNKLCSQRHKNEDKPVAVVNDDGSIDFVNACTNGTSDVLKAAAELIQ